MTKIGVVGALAFAAFLLAPAAALAKDFTIFVYETPADLALRADAGAGGDAYWRAYADFGATLGRDGVLRGGAPLVPDLAARTADGLVLGGFFNVEAPSIEEARAYATRAPSTRRGGRAVVAEHVSTPGMTGRR